MSRWPAWLGLLLLAALAWPAPAPARDAPPLEFVEHVTGGAPGAPLPVIIAVHGLGDRPEDFIRLFRGFPAPARIVAPRGPAPHGRGWSWFPVQIPVKADDPAMAEGLRASAARLAALAAWLQAHRSVSGRPVITGFSQGGMLSFAVALHHPDAIGAAVPIAGALPPALWTSPGPGVGPPIRALHGTADAIVPFMAARGLVFALAAGGHDATLRPFEGVGHRIPPPMRAALFEALGDAIAGDGTKAHGMPSPGR